MEGGLSTVVHGIGSRRESSATADVEDGYTRRVDHRQQHARAAIALAEGALTGFTDGSSKPHVTAGAICSSTSDPEGQDGCLARPGTRHLISWTSARRAARGNRQAASQHLGRHLAQVRGEIVHRRPRNHLLVRER